MSEGQVGSGKNYVLWESFCVALNLLLVFVKIGCIQ